MSLDASLRTVVADIADLPAMVGLDLPVSAWRVVEAQDLERFAVALSVPRMVAGGGIAAVHMRGFVLSVIPRLCEGQLEVTGVGAILNYGLDMYRFPEQARVRDRIRVHTTVSKVDERSDGSVLLTRHVLVELERSRSPACTADLLRLYLPDSYDKTESQG